MRREDWAGCRGRSNFDSLAGFTYEFIYCLIIGFSVIDFHELIFFTAIGNQSILIIYISIFLFIDLYISGTIRIFPIMSKNSGRRD